MTPTGKLPDGSKATVNLRAAVLLWPTPTATPTATPYGTNRGGAAGRVGPARPSLEGAAREWPTPAARDWRDDGEYPSAQARNSPCLPAAVTMEARKDWPTPTASGAKASGASGYSTASGRHSGTTLTDAVVGPRGPEKINTTGKRLGSLNPEWVGQLMGFPDGWLDPIDGQD